MFIGNVMHLPGQGLREFRVKQAVYWDDDLRDGQIRDYEEIGRIKGILAQATPSETQMWRQLSHPVSHKIIMRGRPPVPVKPGYVLELDGQRFYVTKEPYNPGGIGHFTIIYCDERKDVG